MQSSSSRSSRPFQVFEDLPHDDVDQVVQLLKGRAGDESDFKGAVRLYPAPLTVLARYVHTSADNHLRMYQSKACDAGAAIAPDEQQQRQLDAQEV